MRYLQQRANQEYCYKSLGILEFEEPVDVDWQVGGR